MEELLQIRFFFPRLVASLEESRRLLFWYVNAMSIYVKSVSHLTSSDLAELLEEQAVENIRLEFKREVPDKLGTLKKLSSFANTFGGLLVIGASASGKDGRIEDLRGVGVEPGYKQKIVNWCFTECSPPINVDVSDPIPSPDATGGVCYVISVPESDVPPHFLNGRKGVWVRTNEFSERYNAALANDQEIQELLHRRQAILQRRRDILERAKKRFMTHLRAVKPRLGSVRTEAPEQPPSTLEVSVMPQFPSKQVCTQEQLCSLLDRVRYFRYRGVGFPRQQMGIMTQFESAIIRQPFVEPSYLEANVWGGVFYGVELNENLRTQDLVGIHLYEFVGHLLMFLTHAKDFFGLSGMTGAVLITTALQGISQRRWVYPQEIAAGMSIGATRQPSGLDDAFGLSTSSSVEALSADTDSITGDLLRTIFFSADWNSLIEKDSDRERLVKGGHSFNGHL